MVHSNRLIYVIRYNILYLVDICCMCDSLECFITWCEFYRVFFFLFFSRSGLLKFWSNLTETEHSICRLHWCKCGLPMGSLTVPWMSCPTSNIQIINSAMSRLSSANVFRFVLFNKYMNGRFSRLVSPVCVFFLFFFLCCIFVPR